MLDWKLYKLSEIAEVKYGKAHQSLDDGNIPAYGSGGLMRYVNRAIYEEESILIPRKGSLNNILFKKEPFWTVDTMFWTILNKRIVYPKFLYYLLTTFDFANMNVGSAVPSMTIDVLNNLNLFVPSLPEQIEIAEILSSLDDKIDILHRQNKTLEQIAETLFRQWFVEETDSSWKIIKVKDVCITITKGTTPTTLGLKFTETGINFIKAESISDEGDLLVNKFAYIDETTHNKLNRSKIEVNDLVITIAGTIGRVALITKRILPANTNQALAILRLDKNTISHNFLYCLFKSTEFKDDFESRVVHAVQPNLSLGEIGDISFKLPDKEKLILGEKQLEVIFQKKENNNIQIQTLTKLRDTLLPKLMSGEVRVR